MEDQNSRQEIIDENIPSVEVEDSLTKNSSSQLGQVSSLELSALRYHNYNCSADINFVRSKMIKKQFLLERQIKKKNNFWVKCFVDKRGYATLSDCLEEMRKKKLVSRDGFSFLKDRFSTLELNVLNDLVQSKEGQRRYTDETKSFAVALHYYSPKAYKFVSSFFSLPCPSTIRKLLG